MRKTRGLNNSLKLGWLCLWRWQCLLGVFFIFTLSFPPCSMAGGLRYSFLTLSSQLKPKQPVDEENIPPNLKSSTLGQDCGQTCSLAATRAVVPGCGKVTPDLWGVGHPLVKARKEMSERIYLTRTAQWAILALRNVSGQSLTSQKWIFSK